MLELLCQTGGTILPADTLVHFLSPHTFDSSSPVPQTVPWTTLLPLDATLNCLFLKPSVFQAVFPQQEGTLFLSMPGNNTQISGIVVTVMRQGLDQLSLGTGGVEVTSDI